MNTKANTLYEVFFQDHPNANILSDVVFSLADAETSIEDYYADMANRQGLPPFEFSSLEEIQEHVEAHPSFLPRAWWQSVEDSDTDSSTQEAQTGQPQTSPTQTDLNSSNEPSRQLINNSCVEQVGIHLQELLQQNNLHLSVIQVQNLLSKAIDQANAQLDAAQPNVTPSELAVPTQLNDENTPWLIKVGENDIALYFGEKYFDSADENSPQTYEEIMSTAKMLAEKYQTSVKTHHFSKLPQDWCWSDIDKILQNSGLISQKTTLFEQLRAAKRLKINGGITTESLFLDEALMKYLKTGNENQDVFRAKVQTDDEEYPVYLTIKDILSAIEIKPKHWSCNDLSQTEILILDEGNFVTSQHKIQNLLR